MWHHCKNAEDRKKLFRKLSHLLHPDKGGDKELFVLLQESYQQANKGKDSEFSKKENTYESVDKIYAGDSRLTVIERIYAYAEKYPSFDTSFVNNIQQFFLQRGYISLKQCEALERCYETFRMKNRGF